MSGVTSDQDVQIFRPSFGRVLAAVVIGVCGLIAVGSLTSEGLAAVLTVWPWMGLVAGATWALYWNPRVVVSDGGVDVVNPFRTIAVPWPTIDDIDTRWALTIVTTFGSFRAWAAPAPGRQVMRRHAPEDRRMGGVRRGETVRPSDLPATESGAAASLVRQRWLRLQHAGYLDDRRVEFDSVPARWHTGTIAAGVALLVLAIVGLAI